ncbi:helix-turn-helix transcriptional regulator [Ramlibacter terrae]|uniref:Helix-turn-helix transcriptional regulator n=1 Tax=Ramlibacter terrae TaxID=2732511 RepID=A0ABX6P780_9BURK|nr:helix-turn-helix transcriptional regulator [Ramlibacter terrae]
MERKPMTEGAPSPAARGRPRSDAIHSELLWAATRMFSRRGKLGTSTREIAAEAGTTERTLFKHFGSKEGLLHAVLDEAVLAQLAPASLAELKGTIRRMPATSRLASGAAALAAGGTTRCARTDAIADHRTGGRRGPARALRRALEGRGVGAAGGAFRAAATGRDVAQRPEDGRPRRAVPAQQHGGSVSRLLMGSSAEAQDEEDVAALASLFLAGAASSPDPQGAQPRTTGVRDVR